jgi:hypothetical protein
LVAAASAPSLIAFEQNHSTKIGDNSFLTRSPARKYRPLFVLWEQKVVSGQADRARAVSPHHGGVRIKSPIESIGACLTPSRFARFD